MAWSTPKTDWNQGDHFNLEDAVRIADNIAYLKDMAAEIYTQTELYGISYRGYYNNRYYYALWDLTVSNINISRLSLDYGYFYFVSSDKTNLLALLKLYYLAVNSVTSVTDVLCPYSTSEGWAHIYYSGYAIEGTPPSYGTMYTYTHLWRYVFPNLRPPLTFELYSNSNRCCVREASGYLLGNEPFWSYSELNTIESRISYVYTNLSSKLGG